jgi:hypothetical protein
MTEILEKPEKEDKCFSPSIKERFELLVKARNFHYDNYNKWMTYFYVAISAIFISFFAIASIKKSEIENKQLFEFSLLLLGYGISLLWYWSSKGYYYWTINFISLVNYYETDIFKWKPKERIYKIFYDKALQNDYINPTSGANVSTSKVAILFSYLISNFWGFLLFFKLFSTKCCQNVAIITSLLASVLFILICSLIIPKYFLNSDIDDFPEIKGKE